jgi:hypothetical protein
MELVTVESPGPDTARDYCLKLEQGHILFFPETPFELTEEERSFLTGIEQAEAGYHKNIAYRPAIDKVTGFARSEMRDVERLRATLRSYSQRVIRFVSGFLPWYGQRWRVDFASFRPQEEEGRSLPTKKRNDLLHVDAFPTRPTGGDLILRVFTNINPTQPRVWLVSDPFAVLAEKWAAPAGLPEIARQAASRLHLAGRAVARVFRAAGLRIPDRTPYDRFMLHFHDYLKCNREYQQNCAKYRFEFPPGSTWMVFTDIVPHAVLSGRYALEQTFLISRGSLLSRQNAPAAILERLLGAPLTGS